MKTRTHFQFRIDRLDERGELIEHLAGVEDFELVVATCKAALVRWPDARIMLRQGARVIQDSGRTARGEAK